MRAPAAVVVSDFDETLVEESTLLPLYFMLATTPIPWVVVRALVRGEWAGIGPHRAIKAQMYREILAGRREEEICAAATGLSKEVRINVAAIAKVQEYTRQGADLVVATPSLEEPVRRILEHKGVAVDRIVGTRATKVGELCTGELVGGESVRSQKAERVSAVLQRYYQGSRVIALGNLPADRAMLKLADCAFAVDGARITPFR